MPSTPPTPLQRMLDGLPEPGLIVTDGIVAAANDAAERVFGRTLNGRDIRLAIRHPAALERLFGDDAGDGEVELIGLGGAQRRWAMTVVTLDETSRFVRLFDRSESHAAEQMRVDFVANASHELRTPLATLVGYAETLREQGADIDEPTRIRFTGIIHDEALRMQRLVEDLISLSRIEGEKFTAPTAAVSVQGLIAEAKENCRNSAGERGCDLRLDLAADLPPVAGDRSQLLQVLDNLIGNSLRYGRPGGTIVVRAQAERDMVHIAVADEGEGIASEHLPRITERFYRVDPGRSRAQGGTGLGLSIVKHIVERHRGRFEIESRVGEGTTAHLRLPVAASLVIKA